MSREDTEKLFETYFGRSLQNLREDQLKAIELLGSFITDILDSKHKLLFCYLICEEPDILGDRAINVGTNIKKEPLKQIISHAYRRLVTLNKGAEDKPDSTVQETEK